MDSLPNNHAPGDAPDEPAHTRRCPSCNGFLRQDWEYEDIPEERVTVWFTYCGLCGEMVKEVE